MKLLEFYCQTAAAEIFAASLPTSLLMRAENVGTSRLPMIVLIHWITNKLIHLLTAAGMRRLSQTVFVCSHCICRWKVPKESVEIVTIAKNIDAFALTRLAASFNS
jgi:hypothetical protein